MPAINKPTLSAFQKRSKMSLSQTYFLAHTARGKLSKEAARGDHDLRLLVGHANLLDGLMLDLADAEREQESWFHQTVRDARSKQASEKRVSWADRLPAVSEDADDDASDDSSDDESDADVMDIATATTTTITSTAIIDTDEDEDMEEDDEDDTAALALTRSPSRTTLSPPTSPLSPPELIMHGSESESDDSEEDDDADMPPSPPTLALAAPAKGAEDVHEAALRLKHDRMYNDSSDDSILLRQAPQAIAAY